MSSSSTSVEDTKKLKPENPEKLHENLKEQLGKNQKVLLHVGNQDETFQAFNLDMNNVVLIDCEKLKDFRTHKKSIEETLETLQAEIGSKPKLTIESFQNWGKTQKAKVISCTPRTKEEITKVIKAAANEKIKVRCAGTRHSWAPLFFDKETITCIVNVEHVESDYENGAKIQISNEKEMEIDIMTGATTDDLKKFQIREKMHLRANAILEVVQMVSVVATGCHGVGKDTKSPSDYVTQMRIFDSKGVLKTYKCNQPNQLRAVSASFGCFGIIYDMTLRLSSEILVRTENRYVKLEDFVHKPNEMESLVKENWSVEMFWFPFNSIGTDHYIPAEDEVWLRLINQKEGVQDKLENEDFYERQDKIDFITQQALKWLSPCIVEHPYLTPYVSLSAFQAIKMAYPNGSIFQELPHAVHFRNYTHKAPVQDVEFAFELKNDDFDKVRRILKAVLDRIETEHEKNRYPLNIAVEMRWMGYSNAYLCPAIIGNKENGGSGMVFYIEILSIAGTKGWKEFSHSVAQDWIKEGGVPHLAKEWHEIPKIDDCIRRHMGEHLEKFKKELEESQADPDGMFLNDTMERLLSLKNDK